MYHRANTLRTNRALPQLRRSGPARVREGSHFRRTSAIVGLVLLLVFGAGTVRELQRRARVHRELDQLRIEIASLERGNIEVEQLLSYLASDSYVEAEAKRSLGLGWSGEQPVVVGEPQRAQPTTSVARQVARPSPAQAWWNYFFSESS